MSHPDFRVGGKVFASLGFPDEEHAVVMLTPDAQEGFVAEMPRTFSAVKGAWGKRGSTQIRLADADAEAVAEAIRAAWQRRAPALLRTSARR
jgi:hypothetical protein